MASTDTGSVGSDRYQRGCCTAPAAPIQQNTVVLAVRKAEGTVVSASDWQSLAGRSIYLQALEEEEGQRVWKSNQAILCSSGNRKPICGRVISPCCSTAAKRRVRRGPILNCVGLNQSAAPIAGFAAVIFDAVQLAAIQQIPRGHRSSVTIWSGCAVEVYDFEFPTQRPDSSFVDGAVTPKYQFYYEVDWVAFPAGGDLPGDPS